MPESGFLTDLDIKALAAEGTLIVEPFPNTRVQPASVDLRLGNKRYEYKHVSYHLGADIGPEDCEESLFDNTILQPQHTVFIGISETITIPPDMIGFIFARSSLTRLGLLIAPIFMNPGYTGQPPLTITNSSAFPITLMPNVRVAQLICAKLATKPEGSYASTTHKYAGESVSPSRIHTDEEIQEALRRVLRERLPENISKSIS